MHIMIFLVHLKDDLFQFIYEKTNREVEGVQNIVNLLSKQDR